MTLSDAQLNTVLPEVLSVFGKREILLLEQEPHETDMQKTLLPAQEKELAVRLLSLPHDAFSVVIGLHYFGFTPEQVGRLFDVAEPTGTARFYTGMLSGFMGLAEGSFISDDSMERACSRAMRHYYRGLERKLRPGRYTVHAVLRWAAAVILILSTAFATRFSVDAAFRERVVLWVMERFEKYSEIRPINEDNASGAIETAWKSSYVPTEFICDDMIVDGDTAVYSYHTLAGQQLTVLITPSDAVTQLDTEDKNVEEYVISGTQVVLVTGDDINQVVFTYHGHRYHFTGDLEIERMKKIVDEVLK